MTLCRICERREATTFMPWTRRPCCDKCLKAVVDVIAEFKLTKAREYLGLEDAMKRHPAGKGPKYRWRDLRAPVIH